MSDKHGLKKRGVRLHGQTVELQYVEKQKIKEAIEKSSVGQKRNSWKYFYLLETI